MPGIKDDKVLEEEILGVDRAFYEQFGKKMTYFRPPNGEYSEKTLSVINSLGYKTIFWSFAYVDWLTNDQKGTKFAYDNITGGAKNGVILLVHAVSKDNSNALGAVIDDLRKSGFEFLSLDQL